ncbi:MAG: LamG-like jellyroll fold domain-containing protein [Candidatus Zixiibacteriota bacterium]
MRYVVLICSVAFVLFATASGTAYGSWQGPVMISDGTGGWCYPRVEVSGNYVHAVWRDLGVTAIKYRRSTDGGITWDPIQTLYSGNSHDPTIAVTDAGYVHIVWYSGPSAIMYCRSTNNGASFASAVTLPTGGQGAYDPQVAASGNFVCVAWAPSQDILFMRSTDSGANWGSPVNVTNDGGTNWEYDIRLAASGSTAYLAWRTVSAPNALAHFRRGTSNGTDWSSSPITLWNQPIDSYDYIAISAYGSNVYVDRDDATIGPAQRLSTDSGVTWGSTVEVGSGTTRQPRVDGSGTYPGNGANVYFRGSGIYVSTGLGTETMIGSFVQSAPSGDIAANSTGDMHVVYYDGSLATNFEIYYYRYSGAAGNSITNTVNLSPYFDWGAISSYAGLAPPGNMGICSPPHSYLGCYFPSDTLNSSGGYPLAWMIPGVHLATNYGPANVRISSCPIGNSIIAVPDRYSNPCSLFAEVPSANLIDQASDLNVMQISAGESKTIPINSIVETMVFLAASDGLAEYAGGPDPDQPLEVQLSYSDGKADTVIFDNIHPGTRLDMIDPSYPPSWIFIFGNEVFVCDPAYFDLPNPSFDGAHSETWHWYALYPDNTKLLSSVSFLGIQSGDHSEVYISALSYAGAGPPPTPGLVGYWRFDEGSGSTAYDETVNHNDGTIRGASWIDDFFDGTCDALSGSALHFHGGGQWHDGDRVLVPHSSSLDITGEFAVAAWIKATGADDYLAIIDKYHGPGGTPPNCGFTLYLAAGKPRFSVYSGNGGVGNCVGTTELRDDEMHLVAGVWDGSYARVYVDGGQEAEVVWALPPVSTPNDLGIGERMCGWGGYLPFLGGIDEVRVYDQALNDNDIELLYCDLFRGDADGSRAIDIDDVVYLIQYIFAGGPAPDPLCTGDADCSGAIDIDDVVFLINYIFAGGPEPCASCDEEPKFDKTTIGNAELTVINGRVAKRKIVSHAIDSDYEVQALQVEYDIRGDVRSVSVESLIDGIQEFHGSVDGLLKVGLLDPYGQVMIPSDGSQLLDISFVGSGKIELINSIAVAKGGGRLNTSVHNHNGLADDMLPRDFALYQNSPNPFNPATEIAYGLPFATRVRLEVYNLLGQKVTTLVDGYRPAGKHAIIWNGTDSSGDAVASGVYFYKLATDRFTDTRKMLLLK